MRAIWMALILSMALGAPAWACSADTDCLLGDRTYRIALPPGPAQGPLGALIFAHGYGGSAGAEMANQGLRALAHENRMALVAPNSVGEAWMIPHLPDHRAEDGAREYAFFEALVEDLSTRHGIDRHRTVIAGFSAGAMLVWNLACHRGQSFGAFLPIAGTFWEPMPTDCPTEAGPLVHIHGTADAVVPMIGRRVWQMHQGDVGRAMTMMMEAGDFADPFQTESGDLTCRQRQNADGKLLALCTHPGGHDLRTSDLQAAIRMFVETGAFKQKSSAKAPGQAQPTPQPQPQEGDQG
ncbi:MAG: PHB depolymerase family esterase [Pseudomonadota bacterium]